MPDNDTTPYCYKHKEYMTWDKNVLDYFCWSCGEYLEVIQQEHKKVTDLKK